MSWMQDKEEASIGDCWEREHQSVGPHATLSLCHITRQGPWQPGFLAPEMEKDWTLAKRPNTGVYEDDEVTAAAVYCGEVIC